MGWYEEAEVGVGSDALQDYYGEEDECHSCLRMRWERINES